MGLPATSTIYSNILLLRGLGRKGGSYYGYKIMVHLLAIGNLCLRLPRNDWQPLGLGPAPLIAYLDACQRITARLSY